MFYSIHSGYLVDPTPPTVVGVFFFFFFFETLQMFLSWSEDMHIYKTTELLDFILIGVCVVNTAYKKKGVICYYFA